MVLLVSGQWFDVFVVFMHISEVFLFIFILHVFTTKVLTVSLLCVSAGLSDIWVTVFYAAELEELRPQLEFVQRHEIMKNGSQDPMLNNPVTVPAAAWRKDDCFSINVCVLFVCDRPLSGGESVSCCVSTSRVICTLTGSVSATVGSRDFR